MIYRGAIFLHNVARKTCVCVLFLLFVSCGKMRIHLRSHLSTTIFVLLLSLCDWTRRKKTQLGKNCLRFSFFFLIYFSRPNNSACSLRVQLPHALWPLMTLCHAWFNDRWITTLAPKLLSQIELASSHTHTHTWIVIKRKVTEKYRGKMALFFFFFPVVKSLDGGDLMLVWVFRFVPYTTFGCLILFYWPGQKFWIRPAHETSS